MRILFIAPFLPANTSAGKLILYRHFSRAPQYVIGAISGEPANHQFHVVIRPHSFLERLARTRLAPYVNGLIHCIDACYDRRSISRAMLETPWDVVLTVAEGWQWQVALEVSEKLRLPLVTIFHDWWPEVVELPSIAQRLFEKRIYHLAAASRLIFCVSEGMKVQLGNNEKSVVLYPIPHELSFFKIQFQSNRITWNLVYAGMLNYIFATQLQSLSELFTGEAAANLHLFGSPPQWETPFYRGFVPRSQLEEELSQADALLVVVTFDLRLRVWAETSFPSKLVEYCRFGRPILLWSPEYSAAAIWARTHGAAMLINQPEPEAVLEAIARLKGNPQQQLELGQKARYMAETLFHPDRIQEQFVQGLERVVREWRGQYG